VGGVGGGIRLNRTRQANIKKKNPAVVRIIKKGRFKEKIKKRSNDTRATVNDGKCYVGRI
jgi:hypothetical protein